MKRCLWEDMLMQNNEQLRKYKKFIIVGMFIHSQEMFVLGIKRNKMFGKQHNLYV